MDKEALAEAFFGKTNQNCCVCCKKVVNSETDFTNEISKQEWNISRFCQKCQDSIFQEE
jgi:hypothetical protein